jgi:hypothetical protein
MHRLDVLVDETRGELQPQHFGDLAHWTPLARHSLRPLVIEKGGRYAQTTKDNPAL